MPASSADGKRMTIWCRLSGFDGQRLIFRSAGECHVSRGVIGTSDHRTGGIDRRRLARHGWVCGIIGWSLNIGCGGSVTPITQVSAGDATPTSAVLWARASVPGPLVFEWTSDPQWRTTTASSTVQVDYVLVPVTVDVTDLVPGMRYYYRATDAAGRSAAGTFRTPALPGRFRGLRFGVSGDWRGDLAPFPAVRNVPERDLDFFVALGDTIYADYESHAVPGVQQVQLLWQFYLKHAEIYTPRFGMNTLADLRAATAIYAVIDDHEITNDFAGGAMPWTDPRFGWFGRYIHDTPLFKTGLRAFQEYHPVRKELYGDTGDARTARKPKLYRYRTFGQDAAVIILDTRTFRDEPLDGAISLEDPFGSMLTILEGLKRNRTLLGAAQLAEFKADLLRARDGGYTWIFVIIPEPIQNLGPILAADRYEGYPEERREVLRFIRDQGIRNVVFIAADIHGTVTNNLTYSEETLGPQIPVDAFEITTGAVAFDPCLGSVAIDELIKLGFGDFRTRLAYDALPGDLKDEALTDLVHIMFDVLGYDHIGLEGSSIRARLVHGGYVSANTFGWTEFEVDRDTQQLRITTYGIPAYRRDNNNFSAEPEVVSKILVDPMP